MPDYILWQGFEKKELLLETDSFLNECILERDENYSIHITLKGTLPQTPMPGLLDYLGKVFGASEPLIATDKSMPGLREYKITNYFIEHQTTTPGREVTMSGIALNVEQYFAKGATAAGDPEFITYWLLNANGNLKYTRSFESHGEEISTVKFGDFATDTYKFRLPETRGWSLFQLDYQGHGFIFGKADEKVANAKGSFVRFERGFFPTDTEVRELCIALSYLFGTFFVLVGHTTFNSASSPIAQSYFSTLRQNIEDLLSQARLPPIPIRLSEDFSLKANPEDHINEFIKAYVQRKDALNLTKVLWYVNHASTQDFFMMMQPLATALDILCNSYLKYAGKTTIVEADRFSSFFAAVADLLLKTMGESEQTSRLLGNIKGTNQIGSGQRYSIMFSELKLALSESENQAMRERSVAVHGSLKDENVPRRIFLTRVFYTLINRILLGILTPEIPYVDYSMKGKRVAPVQEAQAGTEKGNLSSPN